MMESVPVSFDWWRCGGRVINRNVPNISALSVNQQSHSILQSVQGNGPTRNDPTAQWQCDCSSNEWPDIHYQGTRAEYMNQKSARMDRWWPNVGCEASADYWYDPREDSSITNARRLAKQRGYGRHVVGVRPPWCPAKMPTDCCGLSKTPPLYQRYCRSGDKPILFITRH